LDEKKNAVLIGKWEHDISDGGCHLYEDPFEKDVSMKTWTNNPKYLLKFDENESGAILKITLAIAEKNWKSKTKNSVGGMIGIYLLEKRENKLTIENLVSNREPSFMPLNVICENYVMSGIKGKSYFIMPSTFEVIFDFCFVKGFLTIFFVLLLWGNSQKFVERSFFQFPVIKNLNWKDSNRDLNLLSKF